MQLSQIQDNYSLDAISDLWRKNEYTELTKELSKYDMKFCQIIQSKDRDRAKLVGNNEELDIEIDYKGDGAFSKITAKYYSNEAIWNSFKIAINQIKA